ncbi:MAG TPA: PAS domain S-box protein [Candidatus Limnocylindria bacterium]|nr:PAS domain S-box protein [Candidatus Limnocylindria bacterium]
MPLLRNLPIKRKLTLIVMLTSGVALLLALAAFTAYQQISFRRALAVDLSVLAEMFGNNVASGLTFQDPKSIETTLKALNARPNIVAAAVYDKAGSVVAKYQRVDSKQPFPFPKARQTSSHFQDDQLDAFRRIQLDGEIIGTIFITSDLRQVDEQFRRCAIIGAVVLVLSSLVAFLFAAKLQHIISGPVSHLAAVASRVASERNYSVRATKHSEDELGRLIDAFNGMLGEIQSRDSALRDARDKLEERVEERTSALRASEEQIRLIVDTAFDAIVSADAHGNIIEWNHQAENVFGWSRAEVVGRNLTETIIPPQHRASHQEGMNRFLASGETRVLNKRIEITALHKDGRELPVELAVSPVRLGETFLFSAFLRDITDRKEAQEKLEAAHKQLLDASRQAGMAEVATGVLHNVGNVLNSVNVSTTLVADQLKKSKVANLAKAVALMNQNLSDLGGFITHDPRGQQLPGYLTQLASHLAGEQAVLFQEIEQLRKNIEHIKDIVAMQQSYAKVSGVTETLNISDLVEDALRMNAGALTRHEVKVIREFADVPPVTIDKHKVLQVLVNLIRNAKYACDDSGRSDKRLTVRVADGDGRLSIAVIDNGVGIPQENLVRIFNHGFTTRKEGHGFGLHSGALAAKEMGGALIAHSEGPGRGASFTLELPLQSSTHTS